MQKQPQVELHHLSFSIAQTRVNFSDTNLHFAQKHYGIVGDNGIGKTTLLQLISSEIEPFHGVVATQASIIRIPQVYVANAHETIADVLNISAKLAACARVIDGNAGQEDFDVIGDDWDIKEKACSLFTALDYPNVDLNCFFGNLSGGQQTKVLLVKAMLSPADFILLDEPTNNLDVVSKKTLFNWIKSSSKGIIIVSHDRELLNQVDEIIELSTKGISQYGGNYRLYKEQKAAMDAGIHHDYIQAKEKIKKVKRSIQQTREKHEQRQKKGRALRKKGKLDKLTANSMKGRSEKSQSRNKTQAEGMIDIAQEILAVAGSKIEVKEVIHADLPATKVPNGKIVLNIDSLAFAYSDEPRLFKDFSLTMTGSERIAISGKNGSGKTTLIKLILGKLEPTEGAVRVGVQHVCYLDQHVAFLEPTLSLIDNLLRRNSAYSTQDAHAALARFNFRNTEATKKVEVLSGGEKIRAGLAISLMSEHPPQLIIIDEPTNHLDIASIEAIESMLKVYEGAMIIISHDQAFINNIGVSSEISLIISCKQYEEGVKNLQNGSIN